MQLTEKKQITEVRDVVVETRCDLCDQKIEPAYEAVEMQKNSGSCDGGVVELFDVCAKCWKEKVVPWMKANGAKPRQFDY